MLKRTVVDFALHFSGFIIFPASHFGFNQKVFANQILIQPPLIVHFCLLSCLHLSQQMLGIFHENKESFINDCCLGLCSPAERRPPAVRLLTAPHCRVLLMQYSLPLQPFNLFHWLWDQFDVAEPRNGDDQLTCRDRRIRQ